MNHVHQKISEMKFWQSDPEIVAIKGGMTNQNFKVTHQGTTYFVRIGEDIVEHGVMRFNELAASRAAHLAGISPAVIHAEPGVMVLQYIDARPLNAQDIRNPDSLHQLLELIQRCHRDIPRFYRGPALVFWVFQVLRDYAQTLEAGASPWQAKVKPLMKIAAQLEQRVGAIDLVFGHNDLLAANFMDDGERLWLIDWDYAGFNSPLFDLGGLASNNEFSAEQEQALLHAYFGRKPSMRLLAKYSAMKCASLLRETMWSMVSELHSEIDFNYHVYTLENLELFDSAWETYQQQF